MSALLALEGIATDHVILAILVASCVVGFIVYYGVRANRRPE